MVADSIVLRDAEPWQKDWSGIKFGSDHIESMGPPGCPYGAIRRKGDHPGLVCWGMFGCTQLKPC